MYVHVHVYITHLLHSEVDRKTLSLCHANKAADDLEFMVITILQFKTKRFVSLFDEE